MDTVAHYPCYISLTSAPSEQGTLACHISCHKSTNSGAARNNGSHLVVTIRARPRTIGGFGAGIIVRVGKRTNHHIVGCRIGNTNLVIFEIGCTGSTINKADYVTILMQLDLIGYIFTLGIVFRGSVVFYNQNTLRGGAHKLILDIGISPFKGVVHTEGRKERKVVVTRVGQRGKRLIPVVRTYRSQSDSSIGVARELGAAVSCKIKSEADIN